MDAWVNAGAEPKEEPKKESKDKKASKRIIFDIDAELHKEFKMLCTYYGSSFSSILRSHIEELVRSAPQEIFNRRQ